MNDNQKKLLIGAGIGAGIWLAYRYTQKMPLLPMKLAKHISATDNANFTGYYDITGANSGNVTAYQKVGAELQAVNKQLENEGTLKPSQVAVLKNKKKELNWAMSVMSKGAPNAVAQPRSGIAYPGSPGSAMVPHKGRTVNIFGINVQLPPWAS